MKKTVKNKIIQDVYKTLDSAKIDRLKTSDRRAVFGVIYPMKRIAQEYEDYQREAAKRLMPANYQEIIQVVNEFCEMSNEDRADALKQPRFESALKENYLFNQEMNKCMSEYLDKDAELEFTPLADEVFDAMCDCNPNWTLGQCVELQGLLCRKGGKE